jgi:hypothetical protein
MPKLIKRNHPKPSETMPKPARNHTETISGPSSETIETSP